MMNKTLTALTGVQVGHSTHPDKLTGCTFILFGKELPISYVSYGGAPGLYSTENLRNGKSFSTRRGVFIAGGSLSGLTSAATISQRLTEMGIGWKPGKSIIPEISGAIVYDLGVELFQYDATYGAEAVDNLSSDPVENGNIGAGTGTAVGKFHYAENGRKSGAMKSGVGSARIDLGNDIMVCALSVVNALGNVVNPDGTILAGTRSDKQKFETFDETADYVTKSNTTISIVGTNVDLQTRENYERLAHFGSQGQVRAIYPVHTSIDGDTVFAFSTEEIKKPLNSTGKYFETPQWPSFTLDVIGNAAAKAVQESIYDACKKAETIEMESAYQGVIPSCNDYK